MELLLLLSLILAGAGPVKSEFESAGCSDEGCGIPCYLKPAEDECHYTPQDPCGTGDANDLTKELDMLNSSLVRLQEKLVQKGVIPAGESCSPFLASKIPNGGVIYSDLLLSIGVTAHFVCNDGFSLHGHGKYECSSDGVWIGEDSEEIKEYPTCENSLVICDALVPISNGHISYHIVDTTRIQPGDVASYSCDTLYTLSGTEYRICLRNGTWSGTEPICNAPPTSSADPSSEPNNDTNNKGKIAIPVGVVSALVVLGLVAAVVTIGVVRYMRKKKITGYEEIISKRKGVVEIGKDNGDFEETDLASHQLGVATLQTLK